MPKKCCTLLLMLLSSGQRNVRTRDALRSPPLVQTTSEIWSSQVTLQGSRKKLCPKPQLPRFVQWSPELFNLHCLSCLYFSSICSCLFIFVRMFHFSNMFFEYFCFSLFITSSRVFPFLFLLSFLFSGFGCITHFMIALLFAQYIRPNTHSWLVSAPLLSPGSGIQKTATGWERRTTDREVRPRMWHGTLLSSQQASPSRRRGQGRGKGRASRLQGAGWGQRLGMWRLISPLRLHHKALSFSSQFAQTL